MRISTFEKFNQREIFNKLLSFRDKINESAESEPDETLSKLLDILTDISDDREIFISELDPNLYNSACLSLVEVGLCKKAYDINRSFDFVDNCKDILKTVYQIDIWGRMSPSEEENLKKRCEIYANLDFVIDYRKYVTSDKLSLLFINDKEKAAEDLTSSIEEYIRKSEYMFFNRSAY